MSPVLLVVGQSPERRKLTQEQPSWVQVMGWREKCGVNKSYTGQDSLSSMGKKKAPPWVSTGRGPNRTLLPTRRQGGGFSRN